MNESSIGTEVAFTGDIQVTSSHLWDKETDAYNINIRPKTENQVFHLALGGTNDSFILVYSNNDKFDLAKKSLALTLTAEQIKEIMKVEVSFIIEIKPLQ